MYKFLIILMVFFSHYALASQKTCSLADGINVSCYKKRAEPILNIALVYYGQFYTKEDMDRIGALLKERFFMATNQMIALNLTTTQQIPFKHLLPVDTDFEYNGITDIQRLRRIWYYENYGARVINEIYDEFKKITPKSDLLELDALLVVTEAQFNALGFANGRVGITENPMEIAWATANQGRTDYIDDYKVVDELTHELGHIMFLGHTSVQCFKAGMTIKEKMACCEKSPSKDDVLSYCRQRNNVDQNFFHTFKTCNQKMIQTKILPAILNGGKWNISGRETCL